MNRARSAVEWMARQPLLTEDQLRQEVLAGRPDHTLDRILDDRGRHPVSRPTSRQRRWAPVAVVGVVVTAVLAAVAVFVLPGPVGDRPRVESAGPPALTATDPATVLGRLADRAAAQPPVPDGRYDYIHTAGWQPDYSTAFATGVPVDTLPWVRKDTEFWVDAEGTGRVRHDGDGDSVIDSAASDLLRPLDLPTDPAALERALLALPPDVLEVTLLGDVVYRTWANQVIEPQVQAALLRLLATRATEDGVRVLGQQTDRLGRPGIAVTMSETGEAWGAPPELSRVVLDHTMIFDPETGALLSYEQVAVEGGEYEGPRPLLRVHLEWVASGRVASTDQLP